MDKSIEDWSDIYYIVRKMEEIAFKYLIPYERVEELYKLGYSFIQIKEIVGR